MPYSNSPKKKKKKTSQRKPVEAHSEPTQISKMESFPTIDNSKRLLAIVTKLSILDVCRVPGHVCDQLILFRDVQLAVTLIPDILHASEKSRHTIVPEVISKLLNTRT